MSLAVHVDAVPRAPARVVAVAAQHTERFVALAMILGAVLLGGAVAVNNGRMHWQGLQWLAGAILALAGGLILCRSRIASLITRGMIDRALVLVVAAQVILLALDGVITGPSNYPKMHLLIWMLVLNSGLFIAIVMQRIGFGVTLMISAFAAAGWGVIWCDPGKAIDVLEFQTKSAEMLVAGENPYHARYRNIYHPSDEFYGPGVAVDGWLTYSFPYPPISVMLVAPAYLAGDVRYAHLAALALAAALLAACGRNATCTLAAALLLTSPRALYIVQSGWTEPFLILLAALLTYCALHNKRSVWIALGLLLAVKQYLILIIPLTRLLGPALGSRRKWRRTMLAAALLAAATIVPFFALDPPAFVRGVVQWQLVQPFRYDALSFTAMRGQLTGETTSGAAGFIAAVAAMIIALWKAPRTPGGFAAGAALVFVSFFALNKQLSATTITS